jgi:hypothetical protein
VERNDFHTAAARAEAKYGAAQWLTMNAKARAKAIYHELRDLDRKAALRCHPARSRSLQKA